MADKTLSISNECHLVCGYSIKFPLYPEQSKNGSSIVKTNCPLGYKTCLVDCRTTDDRYDNDVRLRSMIVTETGSQKAKYLIRLLFDFVRREYETEFG